MKLIEMDVVLVEQAGLIGWTNLFNSLNQGSNSIGFLHSSRVSNQVESGKFNRVESGKKCRVEPRIVSSRVKTLV